MWLCWHLCAVLQDSLAVGRQYVSWSVSHVIIWFFSLKRSKKCHEFSGSLTEPCSSNSHYNMQSLLPELCEVLTCSVWGGGLAQGHSDMLRVRRRYCPPPPPPNNYLLNTVTSLFFFSTNWKYQLLIQLTSILCMRWWRNVLYDLKTEVGHVLVAFALSPGGCVWDPHHSQNLDLRC